MGEVSRESEGGFSQFRELDGWLNFVVKGIFIAMPLVGCFFVLDGPSYLDWKIMSEQFYGLMLAMILPCTFILVPASRGAPRNRVPWYDFVLAMLGIIAGLYVAMFYRQIVFKLGDVTPERAIIGTIALGLILEATRRTATLFLALFGLFFILFPHISWLISDVFATSRLPFAQQVNYLYLDTNGVLGIVLGAICTIIVGFLLFGNLLFTIGGGNFITEFAMAIFGRFRGGPAKIAVVASSMFATISGIAVANVATTGVVTIPLMKKIGYRPHLAGAIEAVASTGGQITPPIMGATAFVMAEILGVPYRQIAIAAIIPAFLYYTAIFFQVDMEAGKAGLKGLPREQLPKVSRIIGKSYLFIIPFAVLISALFILFLSPAKSALVGVLSILIIGLFIQKGTRFRFGWVLEGLRQTSRGMLLIGPMGALAGIVVGTISYTGMGFLLSLNLTQIAGGNLFILLPIVALACFILGMGMPTLCAYIILAVLIGPAIVQLGIELIAAHLFILFFAIASMVTPPVCIAAYAGAAIAGADPMRTGLVAARFAIIKYIIPFLFVFFPALIFKGPPGEIVIAVTTAILGCFVLSAGLSGHLFKELSLIKRLLLVIAGFCLLIPIQSHLIVFSIFINLAGGGVALLFIVWEWRRRNEELSAIA